MNSVEHLLVEQLHVLELENQIKEDEPAKPSLALQIEWKLIKDLVVHVLVVVHHVVKVVEVLSVVEGVDEVVEEEEEEEEVTVVVEIEQVVCQLTRINLTWIWIIT